MRFSLLGLLLAASFACGAGIHDGTFKVMVVGR